jgi:hypothetical protein
VSDALHPDHAYASIVLELDGDQAPTKVDRWAEGPAEFPFRARSEAGGDDRRSDASRRSTYFHERINRVLYPLDDRALPRRRWTTTSVRIPGATIDHLEYFELPLSDRLHGRMLILHADLTGDDPAAALRRLVRTGPGREALRAALEPVTGPLTFAPVRGVHVVFARVPVPVAELDQRPAPERWSPYEQLLWNYASASTPETFEADSGRREVTEARLHLSTDWQALVLRDGMAFLAGPREAGGPYSDFVATTAPVNVRALYLDIALLFALQRWALRRLADELFDISSAQQNESPLHALHTFQRELLAFRNRVWWDVIAGNTRANRMLELLQHHSGLPRQLQTLVDESESVVAATETFTRIEAEERQRREDTMIGFVATVAAPTGVIAALMAVATTPSWAAFGLTLLLSVVAVTLLLWRFPELARGMRTLGRSRGSKPTTPRRPRRGQRRRGRSG